MSTESGKIAWRSPSNIALVKYWGKHGNQLPNNSSISFTLSAAHTDTSLLFKKKDASGISLDFLFEGKENEAFGNRITKFLQSITTHFPFLEGYHLEIASSNSFPHSTGIASSAAAMSALALCLCSMESMVSELMENSPEFLKKASMISRLGSGSACRSVYPWLAEWGYNEGIEGSSDDYAIPFAPSKDIFKTYCDSILIASSDEKKVSSSAGHELMNNNRYSDLRYKQANENTVEIIIAMESGDLEKFGHIVEEEALTLHALMMTSNPSYILMTPATLSMIERIRDYRQQSKLPVYFTLDAGPNIHLLYPDEIKAQVIAFINSELVKLCENEKIIHDRVGIGAEKMQL